MLDQDECLNLTQFYKEDGCSSDGDKKAFSSHDAMRGGTTVPQMPRGRFKERLKKPKTVTSTVLLFQKHTEPG